MVTTDGHHKGRKGRTIHLLFILAFGILLLGFASNELRIIWTSEQDLSLQRGTLHSVNHYVYAATDSRGHSSQVSEVIFYLNEHNQKYVVRENIGDHYQNEAHSNLRAALKGARGVTVGIRKSELHDLQPEVFQIEGDGSTLLNFEPVRSGNQGLAMFSLALGCCSVLFFFYRLFPEKFKKLLN